VDQGSGIRDQGSGIRDQGSGIGTILRYLVNDLGSLALAPRTRFAPSPTGVLHLGHVVNAIYVWGLAGVAGGEVLLRIEDHDRQRARPEFERALLDDLDWLGFAADIFPTPCFRAGRCEGRQSDRAPVYAAQLQPLVARGLVYGCDCSRKQIEGPVYGGRCRDRGLPLAEGVGWRLRLDAAVGGDVLVRDRLGNWTYQWCVSVDDTLQAITHVIRGDDLRDSTARQIAIAALLGRDTPPAFVHHPLIMKSATRKLSKSDGDTGIGALRAAGWSPARVICHAAFRIGLTRDERELPAPQVRTLFP
jgi:glutamyl-Q tRNA(Asp) synthetase